MCDPCSNPIMVPKWSNNSAWCLGWTRVSRTLQCAGQDRGLMSGDGGTQETRTLDPTSWHWHRKDIGHFAFFLFVWVWFFFMPFSFGRKGEEPCPRKSQNLLPCLNSHVFPLSCLELAGQWNFQSWRQSEIMAEPQQMHCFLFLRLCKLPYYCFMILCPKIFSTLNVRTFQLDQKLIIRSMSIWGLPFTHPNHQMYALSKL